MAAEPEWDLPQDVDAGWDRMASIKPRHYVCYYSSEPPRIDGRLDDPAWRDDVWTRPFVDIEGSAKPSPRYMTRVAMRWNDSHLFVAALLEEPHVWGTLTERNSVLFQDNDFEVFIDPDGDNHNYYELEINALNTIWELTLEKPYRDGGPVHSPTNLPGLRSAVHVNGTLNAPHDVDQGWSLEIAIPWRGLDPYAPGGVPPKDGEQWRFNFSRVEWDHEVVDAVYRKIPDRQEHNWVWSPQGVVDMHRPERWGYVQFSRAAPGEDEFRPDGTLEAREALMAVYYAQRAHHDKHGEWAGRMEDLAVDYPDMTLHRDGNGYFASIEVDHEDGSRVVLAIDHESRLQASRR